MERKSIERWMNATVIGIGLSSLFSDLSNETITAVLPAFLASMGAAAALGTIEGVADGLSSVAKLYGGWLADRVQRRKVLCATGYGVMALAAVTGLGDLFSSFTVGWLWAAFGAQVAFGTSAALMAIGIVLMLRLSAKITMAPKSV